jgi:F0F1-type ATP synthase assembly protein I
MKIRPQVKPASKGADEGWAVLSTLISGFVVFGGIGWLLDRWWDTHLMVPIGLIVGMALSIYAVVMQFGRPDAASSDAVSKAQKAGPAAQSASMATALRSEKALNRARAVDRARAAAQAPPAHPPNDGPPPASTRRETECL